MLGPSAHADVSADGVVKAAPGAVVAVLLSGSAGNAATLILYDNASAASGTVLVSMTALAGDTVTFTPSLPYVAANGIYADIGGTNANATVVYQ